MSDMKNSAVYSYEELSELKRQDLNKRAKLVRVNDLKGKNEDLIERIITKTKTVRCTWNEDGNLVAPQEQEIHKGVRTHPVLGEWKNYIVEARDIDLKDETFANNDFAARIKMGETVSLPVGFAKFIRTACYTLEHYYDETKRDPATGQMGLHTSRKVSDFFCNEI